MNEAAAGQGRSKNPKVEIKQRPNEVLPFLKSVQKLADAGRNALGFFPFSVYEDAARAGCLYVAVSGKSGCKFCGYVLFGDKFPYAKISQVSVVSTCRGFGIGKLLVNTVVSAMEQKGYMCVSARVANDLKVNEFWQQLQFLTVIQKHGGASRKRLINVRLRELNTPSLFGASLKERVFHLPLQGRPSSRPAVYVVDLNVFFDVVKRRPRRDTAGPVFAAGFKNLVRIVVAEESINELRRSSKPNSVDDVLEMAGQLQTISAPGSESTAKLIPELALMVFPNRQQKLRVSDKSDLIHLATAIYHTASGFITNDKAILEAAPRIRAAFGVEVVDAQKFGESVKRAENLATDAYVRLGANHLRILPITPELRPSLDALTVPLRVQDAFHVPSRQSLIAFLDEAAVVAITWSCGDPLERLFSATIAADEDHPAVETALEAILYQFSQDVTKGGPSLLRLQIPAGQNITVQLAKEQGFCEVTSEISGNLAMERISYGGIILPEQWQEFRSKVEKLSGIRFQELPTVGTLNGVSLEIVAQDGSKRDIDLSDLESTMSPICFIFPHRTSAIVPIQPHFAAELLGTSKQGSLLPREAATLFPQRTYYRTSSNAQLLSSGTIVVFYESEGNSGNGRMAAIALARIISTNVVAKSEIPEAYLTRGVLDAEGVQNISSGTKIAVVLFDNVIEIPNPVPFKQLLAIGCADRANLVSAQSITPDHLGTIVRRGWGFGR
jgi:predicted nucleic acid-binding protein/GNAT superfamily N-acetyltransferase